MLWDLHEDFGHKFGDVPGAYMAHLAELQLCLMDLWH